MRNLRRYLPPVVAVFLLVLGVVAGITLVQSPQEVRERAAPSTTVFVSPSSQSAVPGGTVNFSVLLNTGSNQIVGMDLVVTYDPSVLNVTSISKGAGINNFNTVVRNTIDNNTGTITYSLFTVDKTKSVSGSNIVALDVTAQVKPGANSGSHTISFGQATSVAALTEGQNVVVSKASATLQVNSTGATPTTTPQFTLAPTQPVQATSTPIPGPGNGGSTGNSSSGGSSSGGSSGGSSSSGKRGDLNGDGKVNIMDLSALLSRFLKGAGNSDLNGDGKTNILDLSIMLSSWGK